MAQPRVLILRAPGTNCDQETAYAFELAGAATRRVHVNRWLENPRLTEEFQILCIPGGFSYGDDVAAGQIFASRLMHHLAEPLHEFHQSGKLVLGICNGFQVLMRARLLPEGSRQVPRATLTWNDSGRYEDRWVWLRVAKSECVFLRGIETMYLPVAHAEGKFVARDRQTLADLDTAGQLPLRYATPSGEVSDVSYPENPNGSQANVAGVCDATGRILGLMPHPERHVLRTHHPQWTRGRGTTPPDGLRLFQNAVAYFA